MAALPIEHPDGERGVRGFPSIVWFEHLREARLEHRPHLLGNYGRNQSPKFHSALMGWSIFLLGSERIGLLPLYSCSDKFPHLCLHE